MQRGNIHFSREFHAIVSHAYVQFHKIFLMFYFHYFTEQLYLPGLRLLYTAAHRLVYTFDTDYRLRNP